jgi:transposase
MSEEPRPVGRPTLYKPEYCEQIILFGKDGMSVAEICGEWEIAKQTFYDWQAAHKEFLDATTRARDLAQSWWEKNGRVNLLTEKFNTTLWIKNMHNRFRDDWYESSRSEVKADITISSADKAIAEIDSSRKGRE